MSKEALRLALEALETGGWNKTTAAITALREALAEQDVDDVYIMGNYAGKGKVSRVTLGGVSFTGNGTAGREADVRPTGFFFQSHRQAQQESDT